MIVLPSVVHEGRRKKYDVYTGSGTDRSLAFAIVCQGASRIANEREHAQTVCKHSCTRCKMKQKLSTENPAAVQRSVAPRIRTEQSAQLHVLDRKERQSRRCATAL